MKLLSLFANNGLTLLNPTTGNYDPEFFKTATYASVGGVLVGDYNNMIPMNYLDQLFDEEVSGVNTSSDDQWLMSTADGTITCKFCENDCVAFFKRIGDHTVSTDPIPYASR